MFGWYPWEANSCFKENGGGMDMEEKDLVGGLLEGDEGGETGRMYYMGEE